MVSTTIIVDSVCERVICEPSTSVARKWNTQGLYLVEQNGPQDLRPRLGELQMPTLVLQGQDDTLVPLRVSETFSAEIANSELVIIDNAGHTQMIEKPAETADAVRAFFSANAIGE